MKFALVLAALLSLAATSLKAVTGDIALSGGYTTLNMSDFNESNDKDAALLKSYGASDSSATKISSGIFGALEASFQASPDYDLNIAPRVEYLSANRCTFSSTFNGSNYIATNDLSLTSVMLGVNSDYSMSSSALSLRGGIYAGYGFAKSAINIDNAGTRQGNSASGSGIMGEISAGLHYKIAMVSLGLDLGYRLATIKAMVDSGSAKTWTKSGTQDAVPLDFGGLNAGGSVAINF